MKRFCTFYFMIGSCFFGNPAKAILSYTLTVTTPGYTPLSGGTAISNFNWGCGGDGMMSSALPIGFTFVYDGHSYTQFQVTENGRLILGNSVAPCDNGCGAGCDVTGPNYQLQPSSGTGGGLAASVIHPTICPLWDDEGFNNSGGKGSYLTTGTAGNHVLTVEWLLINWKFSNTAAPATTGTISFQVKLYESPAGQIDFCYRQDGQGMGATPAQHAKIGLTGFTAGDFYATTAAGATPSKTLETDVNTKPANGAQFRWTVVIPTPIELLYFSGENKNNRNVLTWETATEKNNNYFTIDRSTDAVNFESLVQVEGAGSSNTLRTYSYTDAALPDQKLLYYRLKQTDYDGNCTYSEIVPVYAAASGEPPAVYFDNNLQQLNVEAEFYNPGSFALEVSDQLGKVVYQQPLFVSSKGRSIFQVLLPSLIPGVYSARITGGKVVIQSKFINY